jgi:hypothetical protein
MLQLCLLLLAFRPQEVDKPLPEAKSFLEEFRKTLQSDRKLLSQYTYVEKETEITLDSNGRTKKSETNIYQVIHGDDEWKTYRRQITRNGVPLTDKELEKQDQKEKERIEKETRKRQNQSEAKRQQERGKTDREERERIDELFAVYDVQLVRREPLEGASTILVTFSARPNYKPKNREGKILQHIAGRAWISEDDHQLAKLEARVIDPISIGAGLLAKLQAGSTLAFERRKVNNEIWLPVRAEASLNGRMLLLKGINLREVTEFSEHKKYTVDTILTFGDAPLNPKPQ